LGHWAEAILKSGLSAYDADGETVTEARERLTDLVAEVREMNGNVRGDDSKKTILSQKEKWN